MGSRNRLSCGYAFVLIKDVRLEGVNTGPRNRGTFNEAICDSLIG